MLNLETFPVGPLGCNCSLLWEPDTGLGVVVDPGGDGAKIRKRVEVLGFTVTALLHTHAHFDHVGATRELQDLWQCPAHLHGDDTFLIEALPQQTGMFGIPAIPQPEMTGLGAGDQHLDLTTLHTPGHTPGSCCFHGPLGRQLGPAGAEHPAGALRPGRCDVGHSGPWPRDHPGGGGGDQSLRKEVIRDGRTGTRRSPTPR